MKWTNSSVRSFAANNDPIRSIQGAARNLINFAAEKGWIGPPFDPSDLAELLGISVSPSETVDGARLVPDGRRFRLEFNPSQKKRRIRFAIAYEIAHTLFPDCRTLVRSRMKKQEMQSDDWQLEMLCNIAASEILMPGHKVPINPTKRLTAEDLIRWQDQLDVSLEAVVNRIVRIERRNCFVFVASSVGAQYKIDYAIESVDADSGCERACVCLQ